MPELPEVETIVRTLRRRLVGATICGVDLRRTDIVRTANADLVHRLHGRKIRDITRRAKRIVISLDADLALGIHLGMSGRLTLDPPAAPRLPHTHLVLGIGPAVAGCELRFRDPRRFGGVWLLADGQTWPGALGPEPLTMRPIQLIGRLAATRRAIKTALLDQALIAGLGNIYADEALHAARIHPCAASCHLATEQVRRLCRAIKLVLRRALRHRGSTLRDYVNADNQSGDFQKLHRVYDRAGEPCLRCRTAIARIVLGGRSTHFCPICQPRRCAHHEGRADRRSATRLRNSAVGKA